MTGKINSVYTGSGVDGPGIRTVVFFQGCPLRCVYCHNPETQPLSGGEGISSVTLLERISRYKNYYGDEGGITFSGGEPLMQAEFLYEMIKLCKNEGIKTAVDTAGSVMSDTVMSCIKEADLIILDIKMDSEEDYKKYMNGSYKKTVDFLDACCKAGTDVWLRKVIVPGINDKGESVENLVSLAQRFGCVRKVELLPFENMCSEKYERIGLKFPLAGVEPMDKGRLEILSRQIPEEYK